MDNTGETGTSSQNRTTLLTNNKGKNPINAVITADLRENGEVRYKLKVDGLNGIFEGTSNPFEINSPCAMGSNTMLQRLIEIQSQALADLTKRLEAEKTLTLAQKSVIDSFNQIQFDLALTPKED